MKNTRLDLLNYLIKSNEIISSRKLSTLLNVSTRSVRNYIQEINSYHKKKLILGYHAGYFIQDKNTASLFLEETKKKSEKMLPQTENERIDYILSKFLKTNTSLDTFDLADELSISYATIKKTFTAANVFLKAFNLKLTSQDNFLSLIGSEQKKRSLMRFYLYNNSTENIMSIKYLENFFGQAIIQMLLLFFKTIKEQFGIQMNDFVLRNMMLHLAIIASRNRGGESLIEPDLMEFGFDETSSSTKGMEIFIADFYQHYFRINLAQSELQQISILIQTNANQIDDVNQNIIGKDILQEVEEILSQLKKIYYFPINYHSFRIPFAIHLKGLYKRIKINKFNQNPLLKDIKLSSPILYDIALFVSDLINKKWHATIPEDEVGYIALHLGNAVNKEKKDREKIDTLLILPDYLNFSNNIFNQINDDFKKDITISAVVQDSSNLIQFSHAQLIISFFDIDMSMFHNIHLVTITPFYSEKDKQKINESIAELHQLAIKNFMQTHLERFMDKKLFFLDIPFQNKYDVITYMTQQMLALGYVSDSFLSEVILREEMSSTAFQEIAIPHSIKMNAKKTIMAIYINPSGIDWHEQTVKIVMLISVSKRDSAIFRKLYEGLVDMLSDSQNLDIVANSNTFEEFHSAILSL
ncbi:TPA_asm: hypothetical protein GIN74_01890 [Listeria monocytogenes]|nr:hypothetical protein [Listeria monocytogenes]